MSASNLLDDSRILGAAEKLLISVRRGESFTDEEADELRMALKLAIVDWRNSSVIPKNTANLFLDITTGLEATSLAYSGDEQQRIFDFSLEVAELIREILTCRSDD